MLLIGFLFKICSDRRCKNSLIPVFFKSDPGLVQHGPDPPTLVLGRVKRCVGARKAEVKILMRLSRFRGFKLVGAAQNRPKDEPFYVE